jgi:putative ABC transport system ATP-binding protein
MIELKQITKIYPGGSSGFKALDSVQLDLPTGEFVAIVGKSGSGKSTLINLIAGLDRPSSGELWVGGKPIHAMDEAALAHWRSLNVGVVFQFFQLLPTLTIAENVILPMDFCQQLSRSQARERALALLDQVGIADQADKLPASLSGGQQQRAALARSLANDPSLIVADEPTGNLDSHTAETVISQLAALTQVGKTVLMVTHERDWAEFAHRVVTMADGRVVGRKLRVDAANNLAVEMDHV